MPRGHGSSNGVNHAPRLAPIQGGDCGSLFRIVAEGITFGIGSAVAHRIVDLVFDPRSIQHETIVNGLVVVVTTPMTNSLSGDTCNAPTKAFQDSFRPILMILASTIGGQALVIIGSQSVDRTIEQDDWDRTVEESCGTDKESPDNTAADQGIPVVGPTGEEEVTWLTSYNYN
ncbi:hypothetical protein HKD37_08G022782 [Glycine soja]